MGVGGAPVLGRAAGIGERRQQLQQPGIGARMGRAIGQRRVGHRRRRRQGRSEEHTSELQSLMRSSYAVFCLKKKNVQRSTNRERRESFELHVLKDIKSRESSRESK